MRLRIPPPAPTAPVPPGHTDAVSEPALPSPTPGADAPPFRIVEGGAARRLRETRERFQEAPIATYLLLILMVAIFAAMYALSKGDVARLARLFGDKDNDLIRAGQAWRLVTAIFLHGNPTHLLVNGLSLYWLGIQMERLYGWRKYLIIFLAAGVSGYLLSFLLSPTPSLGASGAIFGLVGAGIVFPLRFPALVPPRARALILRQLITVAVINLAIGLVSVLHVDNWAHLGGLAGGGFVALFLVPEALEQGPRSRASDIAVSLAAIAAIGVIGWAALAQWRTTVQNALGPTITIGPATPDPWWSIELPQNWKQRDGVWITPQGVTLHIGEFPRDPRLIEREVEAIQRAGAEVTSLLLDEQPTDHILYKDPTTRHLVEIYLVKAYRHVISLRWEYPTGTYLRSQQVVIPIVRSLRVLHAPPAAAPGSAASPGATPPE
ncbi:MAG TPA: rhomboid family intramembrane serine protease [Chthonomonadaceae bacterium]|nr:rhomboid family intramembrane serine protease [Chthonomonadaceae bacterium]